MTKRYRRETPLPKRTLDGAASAQRLRDDLAAGFIAAREANALSRTALAASVDMHRNNLLDVEEGYANPTLARIGRLADLYEVDIRLVITPRQENAHG